MPNRYLSSTGVRFSDNNTGYRLSQQGIDSYDIGGPYGKGREC